MIVLHSLPRLLSAEDCLDDLLERGLGPTGDQGLQSHRSGRPLPEEEPRARAEIHPARSVKAIVTFALSRPKDHGWQGPTSWSLDLLQETLVFEGVVESISRERLRQILLEESVTFQSVKTWKSSKDPKFAEKLRRLNELTNRPHNPPIVVSVDEMGPISLQPYGGHTWAQSGHPDRVPATYQRLGGVRYLMGAYDYYHHRFRGYLSPFEERRRVCALPPLGPREVPLGSTDLSDPG